MWAIRHFIPNIVSQADKVEFWTIESNSEGEAGYGCRLHITYIDEWGKKTRGTMESDCGGFSDAVLKQLANTEWGHWRVTSEEHTEISVWERKSHPETSKPKTQMGLI